MGIRSELQPENPAGNNWHDFAPRAVAEKSRCVTETAHIVLIINSLCWSGRRDSNPRPSAPKADQIVYGTLLKQVENKCLL